MAQPLLRSSVLSTWQGSPRTAFYLYRSHWNKDAETLHILPHWTWPGREGQVTPIFVYTNHPEAELFINGKSQGRQKKDTSITIDATENKESPRGLHPSEALPPDVDGYEVRARGSQGRRLRQVR